MIAFLILLVPAIYGYNHTSVYYNLDSTLPEESGQRSGQQGHPG